MLQVILLEILKQQLKMKCSCSYLQVFKDAYEDINNWISNRKYCDDEYATAHSDASQ